MQVKLNVLNKEDIIQTDNINKLPKLNHLFENLVLKEYSMLITFNNCMYLINCRDSSSFTDEGTIEFYTKKYIAYIFDEDTKVIETKIYNFDSFVDRCCSAYKNCNILVIDRLLSNKIKLFLDFMQRNENIKKNKTDEINFLKFNV